MRLLCMDLPQKPSQGILAITLAACNIEERREAELPLRWRKELGLKPLL